MPPRAFPGASAHIVSEKNRSDRALEPGLDQLKRLGKVLYILAIRPRLALAQERKLSAVLPGLPQEVYLPQRAVEPKELPVLKTDGQPLLLFQIAGDEVVALALDRHADRVADVA